MFQGTFSRNDLEGVITLDELTKLETRLQQLGEPTPTPTAIARAVGRFNRYTSRYLLDLDDAKQHIGNLVVYFLFKRLGQVPPARQKDRDDTMDELTAYRDGKFPDAPLDPATTPAQVAPAGGRYGSKKPFSTR